MEWINGAQQLLIDSGRYHAVIFDMDGVITKTAGTHALAWKRLFDEYMEGRSEPWVPFDANVDYARYVDGKPRLSGIRSFLDARGITLPLGSSDDGPEAETLHGLASRKNGYFLNVIEEEGVEAYESTIALVHSLKGAGVKVAVISSSCNCEMLLGKIGILDLFEVRVDGLYSERYGLAGKPSPDIFFEAAQLLGEAPADCVVVEDALSGVAAGRVGGFALVIGIDRIGQRDALITEGADVVVDDLDKVVVAAAAAKPNAIDSIGAIRDAMMGKHARFFFDYDGTLCPIAPRPEDARFHSAGRKVLRALAVSAPVVILSGRCLSDIRAIVGIDAIYYGGSHGFEIAGPGSFHFEYECAANTLPLLSEVGAELQQRLAAIVGVWVECKRYAVAIHYRLVAPEQVAEVVAIVDALYQENMGQLRKTTGKMLIELQPKVHWNKGCALLWLSETLGWQSNAFLHFYIGDDKTDEDVFKVLRQTGGIAIAVQEEPQPTAAAYTLKNPDEVFIFLAMLTQGGLVGG